MKKNVLTGDRPTGQLHIGHYVGSLLNRLELQKNPDYQQFVFIADLQALTDNYAKSKMVAKNVLEVACDYLAVGLDPQVSTLFIQSLVPELSELTVLLLNFVTLSRLQRNPTIKEEIKQKNFGQSVPTGFLVYPISQAADILAFNTSIVPVGEDQKPLIEQTVEIVRSFNNTYGEILIEPKCLVSANKVSRRLPGIDGKAKMSKSLNNAIYLADDLDTIKEKVMKMYTDPNHLKVSDPGQTKDNPVFMYLEAFVRDEHFKIYLDEYKNFEELKSHYERGGLGDVKVKKFLINVLNHELEPIRNRRQHYMNNPEEVMRILKDGSEKARILAKETLLKIKRAMGIDYE